VRDRSWVTFVWRSSVWSLNSRSVVSLPGSVRSLAQALRIRGFSSKKPIAPRGAFSRGSVSGKGSDGHPPCSPWNSFGHFVDKRFAQKLDRVLLKARGQNGVRTFATGLCRRSSKATRDCSTWSNAKIVRALRGKCRPIQEIIRTDRLAAGAGLGFAHESHKLFQRYPLRNGAPSSIITNNLLKFI